MMSDNANTTSTNEDIAEVEAVLEDVTAAGRTCS